MNHPSRRPHTRGSLIGAVAAILVGCSSSSAPPTPTAPCAGTSAPLALAPGATAAVDASTATCVAIAGGTNSEFVYVGYAAAADQGAAALTAPFALALGAGTSALTTPGREVVAADAAAGFHAMLRGRERAVAGTLRPGAPPRARVSLALQTTAPVVGSSRSLNVCSTIDCTGTVPVTATARYVGTAAAIYLDDAAPAGGYAQADLDSLGTLFDRYLFPLDTVAFGAPTDIDANGRVVILLSPRVNQLTPACNSTGSLVLGYFLGDDLVPSRSGSNAGEIFYGLVPDPGNSGCTVSAANARKFTVRTLIHELQHMISFGQHVLTRGGDAEETWLNEGLSHFAEELGGRYVPAAWCIGGDCLTQYTGPNFLNAYRYLSSPSTAGLIESSSSLGTPEERGANWLFIRWLADHFGGADTAGTAATRALVNTAQTGSRNVAALTQLPMATVMGEWHLANYLDDLPGFTSANPRLQYRTWNLRRTFGSLNQQNFLVYGRAYPLIPDSTISGNLRLTGTLRAGVGVHARILSQADAFGVRFAKPDGTALPSSVAPSGMIVRVR